MRTATQKSLSTEESNKDTGTRDEHYDLISVLYHTLQGCETASQYANDAERAGDKELAAFFRDVQEEDKRRCERGKQLLASRMDNITGKFTWSA